MNNTNQKTVCSQNKERNNMKLKQDDIIKVQIIDQGMDGEGIARLDDYILFIPYALTGEEVQAKVTYVKKNLVFCTLIAVLSAAKERLTPVCNRFTRCGGCDLMHQEYSEQLKWKKKNLEVLLRKNGGIIFPVADVVASESPLGYRNKIQLPFGEVNDRVAMGFFRENTHKIVSITKCFLHGEWVEKLIGIFLDYANINQISVYNENKKTGILRHMVARNLDGKLSIVVVTNNSSLPKVQLLIKQLNESFQGDYALYYCPKKEHNNVIMGDKIIPIVETPLTIEVLGIKVDVNPYSFLQLNNEIRDKIYNAVIEQINANSANNIVIDAYAGVGIIGAVLAKNGAQVYNIEIVKEATEDADKLAKNNNLSSQITNINGDAAVELPILVKRLLDTQSGYKSYLNIILDPPRKGCDAKVINALNGIDTPHNLYYISCNPSTLSRDLKLLTNYTIKSINPFDMFPNTKHVECVVLMSRVKE